VYLNSHVAIFYTYNLNLMQSFYYIFKLHFIYFHNTFLTKINYRKIKCLYFHENYKKIYEMHIRNYILKPVNIINLASSNVKMYEKLFTKVPIQSCDRCACLCPFKLNKFEYGLVIYFVSLIQFILVYVFFNFLPLHRNSNPVLFKLHMNSLKKCTPNFIIFCIHQRVSDNSNQYPHPICYTYNMLYNCI